MQPYFRSGSVKLKKKYLKTEDSRSIYQFLRRVRERNRPFAGIQVDSESINDVAFLKVAAEAICNVPLIAMFTTRFLLSKEYCFAVSDLFKDYRRFKSSGNFEERAFYLLKSYETLADGLYSPAVDFMFVCQTHGEESFDIHTTLGRKMTNLRKHLDRNLKHSDRFVDNTFLVLRNASAHAANRTTDVRRKKILILDRGKPFAEYSLRQLEFEFERLMKVSIAIFNATFYYLIYMAGFSAEVKELLAILEAQLTDQLLDPQKLGQA